MPRVSEDITRNTLKRLAEQVGESESEVADARCTGLSIRVRKSGATWTLRGRLVGKQSTWRIGSIAELQDPKAARERAEDAKRLLKRGVDPSDWLKEQQAGGPVLRTGNREKDGWLWPEACAAFLEAKAKNRSPKTIIGYRNALNAPDIRGKFSTRPMKSISTKEMRQLVEAIAASGKTSQANAILRVVKSMFSWCTQQSMSGIADTPSVVSIVAPREHQQKRGHVPTIADLARLFPALDNADVLPQGRIAAALLALTAQRRETIITARIADFLPDPERPGWGMWRMEADPQLHIDRHHAIPLPPLAWGLVNSARMLSGSSPWLFPQLRRARIGDDKTGHMCGNVVAEAFTLATGGRVTPHDIRRALATHGPATLRIRDEDTKKVLNHASGRDVTSRYYAFHESIPDKAAVLEKWERWLAELMAQHLHGGKWPMFLPQVSIPAQADVLMFACEPPRVRAAS